MRAKQPSLQPYQMRKGSVSIRTPVLPLGRRRTKTDGVVKSSMTRFTASCWMGLVEWQ